MNVSDGRVKNSESNTQEVNLPDEYVARAKILVADRHRAEDELRKNLDSVSGRDDRLSGKLRELDIKLRNDIALLRKEYGLDEAAQ